MCYLHILVLVCAVSMCAKITIFKKECHAAVPVAHNSLLYGGFH